MYSSRVRSLVDAVYDWSRFNSLPRGYEWIGAELTRDPGVAGEIVRVALQYANVSTLRRLGKLLELEGVAEPLLPQTGAKAHAVFRPDISGRRLCRSGARWIGDGGFSSTMSREPHYHEDVDLFREALSYTQSESIWIF